MIKELRVQGFKTLIDTSISFDPFTILLGKNGAGKTAILDSLQTLGNFARGGVDRAFGPPPWSLGWLRTRGIGTVPNVRFELTVSIPSGKEFIYYLSLSERGQTPTVEEERLLRKKDSMPVASYSRDNPPRLGTILKPEEENPHQEEIRAVADLLESVTSYELNPKIIEQGFDAQHTSIGRDGFGISSFLAHLKDKQPDRFNDLENRLKEIRGDEHSLDIWWGGDRLYWGMRPPGQERALPAVHLSWGDRQLVGLLCVLYATPPGAVIALEEVDRGLHPSRYYDVLDLLSIAAYDGITGQEPIQIVMTTHSPSFVNKMDDRATEIRAVMRFPEGGTLVRSFKDLMEEKLGTDSVTTPLGQIWEMGVLENLGVVPQP